MKLLFLITTSLCTSMLVSCIATQPTMRTNQDVEAVERQAPVNQIQSNARSVAAESDYSNNRRSWGWFY